MPQAKTKAASGKPTKRSAIADVVAREYTIHLHKRVRSTTITPQAQK
jgi:large subunit ribosomal protein L31e